RVELLPLERLLVERVEQVLIGLLDEDLAPEELLDDPARRLARAETGQADLVDDLAIGAVERLLELLLVGRDIEEYLTLREPRGGRNAGPAAVPAVCPTPNGRNTREGRRARSAMREAAGRTPVRSQCKAHLPRGQAHPYTADSLLAVSLWHSRSHCATLHRVK